MTLNYFSDSCSEGFAILEKDMNSGNRLSTVRRVLVLVTLLLLFTPQGDANATSRRQIFSAPTSIAVSAKHVWVANNIGNFVTELNARDGSLAQLIKSKKDGFSSPGNIIFAGSNVWVTNSYTNSITELSASNGSLVRVIGSKGGKLDLPGPAVVIGRRLWVINFGSDSLSEFNVQSGRFIRMIRLNNGYSTADQSFGPVELAASKNRLFVSSVSPTEDSLIELNSSTGVIGWQESIGPSTPNTYFGYLTATSSACWITTNGGNSLVELNAVTGLKVRQINNGGLNEADGITSNRSFVYVSNAGDQAISVYAADTGRLIHSVKLKSASSLILGQLVIRRNTLWVLNTLGSILKVDALSIKIEKIIQ